MLLKTTINPRSLNSKKIKPNRFNRLAVIQKIIFNGDFYYTSGVRDLLFNIQEHRFTIPQIFQILKDLNLEFLGFNFNNNNTKEEYKKKFPKDKKCNTLDNWHEFEKKNPTTFDGMYQFWVRKL